MIPVKVGALLAQGLPLTLPGSLNTNDSCEGAKFHSPTPLIVRRLPLWPGMASIEVDGVWLCGTCADNLAIYQHLLLQESGKIDWEVRREFGNLIRAIGQRSWEQYIKQIETANG